MSACRGGANRLALAVQNPARRPARERGDNRGVQASTQGDVEIELVRLERDIAKTRLAEDSSSRFSSGA
jgi:hypothetical protein